MMVIYQSRQLRSPKRHDIVFVRSIVLSKVSLQAGDKEQKFSIGYLTKKKNIKQQKGCSIVQWYL